jgi:hypothetical protein
VSDAAGADEAWALSSPDHATIEQKANGSAPRSEVFIGKIQGFRAALARHGRVRGFARMESGARVHP